MQNAFDSFSENSDTSFDHYAIYDLDSEPEDDYGKGGFMKIPEEIEIGGRYEIIQKIGWGHGGLVYLSKDLKTDTFVALKILKSHRYYRSEFKDEVKMRERLSSSEFIVNLKDHFKVEMDGEDHTVAVYELMGVSLYEILKYYKFIGLPIALCRFIGKEILKALIHFHQECGIIVGDLRLKNILIQMTAAQETSLQESGSMREKLDFSVFRHTETPLVILNKHLGCNFVLDSTNPVKKGKPGKGKKGKKPANPKDILKKLNKIGLINEKFVLKFSNLASACPIGESPKREVPSVNYLSPEIVLKLGYSEKVDIWSFACLMFELVTGQYLFEPFKGKGYRKEDDLLAQIREVLGPFNQDFLRNSNVFEKYFDQQGKVRHVLIERQWPLFDLLVEKYFLAPEEARPFAQFLTDLLVVDSFKRPSAAQVLEHQWFKMPPKEVTHLNKEKIKETEEYVRKREFEFWNITLRGEEYKFNSRYK
jgi:serine/threonine-protein kinase SRPK3